MKHSLLFIALLALHSCTEKPVQRADNEFDVGVAHPTFTTRRPVVVFDEAHNNFHTSTGLYQPFARLITNDGYSVVALRESLSTSSLRGAQIFVIANARGGGDLNETPAFTDGECELLHNWVFNGGSLLLIADHFPFGSAVERLAKRFGVNFQKGMVEDSVHYDSLSRDNSQLVFSKDNGLLAEHEITRGIGRVITFTGQSIQGSDSCFSFLRFSQTAYDLQPQTTISKNGNDTRVEVTYHSPVSAAGRSQGIAQSFGKGRIVVVGEAAMLTAQKNRDDSPIGMNYNPDNKVLALQIIHWLTNMPQR